MNVNNKQVAIVGGGPGGLMLARLLQIKNVALKVYERDFGENARVQGSPLDMHEESGLAAIRKAGLLDSFKENFLPGADRKKIVDPHATVFLSDHDSKAEENFGQHYFRPEIDRGSLRKILLESLANDTVAWNHHFISMQPEGNGWRLHFKNDLSAYADIVIAADGANSKIRPYLTEQKPFYTGITMLEGNVHQSSITAPRIHKLLSGGKIMAFGKEKNILLGQKGNGDIGFYISFKADQDWVNTNHLDYSNQMQMLAWFKEEYKDWDPVWQELFEKTATAIIPRPIYCMPLQQQWTTLPNLTMIGDAAHVMPPFAGEGANMAMLDALELSECFTTGSFSGFREAIAAYESNMRERAAAAARESLENGERMHLTNALQEMLDLFNELEKNSMQ